MLTKGGLTRYAYLISSPLAHHTLANIEMQGFAARLMDELMV
jgi:hypothetical protein